MTPLSNEIGMNRSNSSRPAPWLKHLICLYFGAVALLWILGLAGAYLRAKWRHLDNNTTAIWFRDGENPHADLLGFDSKLQRFKEMSTGAPIVVYPAPMMAVYSLLTRSSYDKLRVFEAALLTLAGLVGIYFGLLLRRRSQTNQVFLFASGFVSVLAFYPLWFDLERSNVEVFLWAEVVIAVIALTSGAHRTAAVFVALAGSMKIYPAVLLLIFIKNRRYLELSLSILLMIGFTLGGLWLLNPNIVLAFAEVSTGLSSLSKSHIGGFHAPGISFDHSLFSPVKQIIRLVHPEEARFNLPLLDTRIAFAAKIYTVLAGLGFVGAYILWIRKLALPNQVIALLVLSITLPQISFEYTLLQILPALVLFFIFLIDLSYVSPVPLKGSSFVLLAFAVLSAPLSYIGGRSAGFGGQVKLVALTAILIFVLRNPLVLGNIDNAKRRSILN